MCFPAVINWIHSEMIECVSKITRIAELIAVDLLADKNFSFSKTSNCCFWQWWIDANRSLTLENLYSIQFHWVNGFNAIESINACKMTEKRNWIEIALFRWKSRSSAYQLPIDWTDSVYFLLNIPRILDHQSDMFLSNRLKWQEKYIKSWISWLLHCFSHELRIIKLDTREFLLNLKWKIMNFQCQ